MKFSISGRSKLSNKDACESKKKRVDSSDIKCLSPGCGLDEIYQNTTSFFIFGREVDATFRCLTNILILLFNFSGKRHIRIYRIDFFHYAQLRVNPQV